MSPISNEIRSASFKIDFRSVPKEQAGRLALQAAPSLRYTIRALVWKGRDASFWVGTIDHMRAGDRF